MEINEEKRNKFMEYAGKRVNNVMHDIQILEPMARSNAYDFTKEDVEEMFNAMHEDGIPVLGYLGWGLIDILSSQGDMRKRYGVVYVNRTNHDLRDMKRVPKKSYHWLKKVIESDGEEM